MREIRSYGSEGGGAVRSPYPYHLIFSQLQGLGVRGISFYRSTPETWLWMRISEHLRDTLANGSPPHPMKASQAFILSLVGTRGTECY